MLSTVRILEILKKFKEESSQKYGITSLGIFGSFARYQQDHLSDLDVVVTLRDSDFFIIEALKEELEQLLQIKIDIVNFRDSLRDSLKINIQKDAIYV